MEMTWRAGLVSRVCERTFDARSGSWRKMPQLLHYEAIEFASMHSTPSIS